MRHQPKHAVVRQVLDRFCILRPDRELLVDALVNALDTSLEVTPQAVPRRTLHVSVKYSGEIRGFVFVDEDGHECCSCLEGEYPKHDALAERAKAQLAGMLPAECAGRPVRR
jgi:hypothetical protein